MDSTRAKLMLQAELDSFAGTRREWYRTVYLKSDHWKNLRALALSFYGRKCSKCPATGTLDVHHLHYRNIYDVRVGDLQILCRPCHELEHEHKPGKKSKKAKKIHKVNKKRRGKKARRKLYKQEHDAKIEALALELIGVNFFPRRKEPPDHC